MSTPSTTTHLFNKVLDTGQVPDQWRRSEIIPLYKKEDPKDVNKFPFKCLQSKLSTYMLFSESNKPLYIAFIDYAKAFDTISHNSIWEALDSCQIQEKYKKVFKNIYNGRTSRVKLEKRGLNIPICRGVKQGFLLSPKLFTVVLQVLLSLRIYTGQHMA